MSKFIQFISGAICPKCGKKDKIAINKENDQIFCVNCDFREKRPKS